MKFEDILWVKVAGELRAFGDEALDNVREGQAEEAGSSGGVKARTEGGGSSKE